MTEIALTANNSPAQQAEQRNKRVMDAAQLRQPDRVPILMRFRGLLPELQGATPLDLYENHELAQEALERAALLFQPDICEGVDGSPQPSRILGDRMTKWPGYGLGPEGTFQYHEAEFMKAEDYDAFLVDPSDWAIRHYLPRVFGELEALAMLPPLAMSLMGYYAVAQLGSFLTLKPVVAAFQKLQQAAEAQADYAAIRVASARRMMELGFPPYLFYAGASVYAPFDFMSDTLRGMKGIFMDLRRCPEKVLAAEERVIPILIEHSIAISRARNVPYTHIPLHRGSDGFISLNAFEKFYWPQLKQVLFGLIDAGITPVVFYEGVWNQRLKYLAELPKGKTVGIFQDTDLIQAKQILGDTMCIVGGMPISLLSGGTPQQVRERTKLMCREVGAGGGFIMTTSVGDLRGCKLDLIQAWADATMEFGVY
jgi:hypothetical protein